MNSHLVRRAIFVGLVVALPVVVCADGDAFKKGMEARDRKDWPRAAAEIRRAIEADSRESNQGIRVGGHLGFGGTEYPYLPYFFLGEALLAQDDCAGAIDAWSRSEQQAVVTGDRLTTIRRGYRTCEAKGVLPPGAYDPLVQRASQTIADAEVLFLRVSRLVSSNRALTRQPADGPIGRARKDLDASRTRLQAGMHSRKVADLTEAAALAERGAEQLRATESAVRAAIKADRAADSGVTAAARSLAEYDRRAAHRPEPSPAGNVSTRDALQKRLDAVQLRLRRARTDGNLVDLERVSRMAAEIAGDIAALTRALGRPSIEERGVTMPLQEGAGLFLRGDYQQALAVLDAAVGWPDTPSLRLHVHLFRAAAHLALYQRSGEADRTHLNLARAAIDQCRGIDPLFQPDPGVFTPRFIELYQRDQLPAGPRP